MTFYSLKTGSCYWGVLLDAESYKDTGARIHLQQKLNQLGLSVSTGRSLLDRAHIQEILTEIRDLRPTRRTMKIALDSGATGEKPAESIVEWFRKLAESENPAEDSVSFGDWGEVLPPSLEVYSQDENASPSSDKLATFAEFAPAELKWFDHQSLKGYRELDAALISEVKPAGTIWVDDWPESPVSNDFLLSKVLIKNEDTDQLVPVNFSQDSAFQALGKLGKAVAEKFQPQGKAIRSSFTEEGLGPGRDSASLFGFPSGGSDPALASSLVPGEALFGN